MSENDNTRINEDEIFKTANIIMAGITGAGKSTLINAVFGDDFAETGKGRPVTQVIQEYSKENVPVKIWDSIGFEIGDENGVSKTKIAIQKIKKTIEEQSSKDDSEHIHAIWYCINQGGSRYQDKEAEFVKELHKIGVPFIIIITQCIDEDDDFAREVNRLNQKNGITDIPVIEVLAQDKRLRSGTVIPSFGLDELVDKTLELLPSFIKSSFIAGQQIKVVLKREECENIIIKYEKMAEDGLWEKVPFINILKSDKHFQRMVKEIFGVYNFMFSEDGYNDAIFDITKAYSKGLFSWCIIPSKFTKNEQKLNDLMEEIREKGAEGLELNERSFKYTHQVARMITYFGYTLLMAVEDVWDMIKEKKIENLEKVTIPIIKERIRQYFSGKGNSNKQTKKTSSKKNIDRRI